MRKIITLDGLAASGKGTLSKALARRLDFAWLDTGLLYRATGLYTKKQGKNPENPDEAASVAATLDVATLMNDPALRTAEAAALASVVGAIAEVRTALLGFQRDFAANPPDGKAGVVLDGRDTGTVICPDAPLKFFVTASVEERARRRYKELTEKGADTSFEQVLQDLKIRDDRDVNRAVVPTKPAPDAIILDTTLLTIDEAIAAVFSAVDARFGRQDTGS